MVGSGMIAQSVAGIQKHGNTKMTKPFKTKCTKINHPQIPCETCFKILTQAILEMKAVK